MDNALCGGAGSTLTGNALNAVKVAIFMGDPHNRAGLPYNVGTCTAGGVSSLYVTIRISTDKQTRSSPPVLPASSVLPPIQPLSSRTATLPIRTAAMATTPTHTSSTSTSTDLRLWLSSRASLLHKRPKRVSADFAESGTHVTFIVHIKYCEINHRRYPMFC